MAVKLKDIAQDAGVSISTVSRILNNDLSRKSNEQTAAKVFEAAERLGYFAQKLAPARYMEYKNADKTFSVACILTSEHETYVSPSSLTCLLAYSKRSSSKDLLFRITFLSPISRIQGFCSLSRIPASIVPSCWDGPLLRISI